MSQKRRFPLVAAAILILCALAVPPGAAGAAEPPPSGTAAPAASTEAAPASPSQAPAPGTARLLSAREALFLARTLLEQGKLEDAEKIYALLSNNPVEEIRIESLFQLSQIRLVQGKFRQAASLLMEILNKRPDLPRVRLELARAYFLDKNYEDAAFQFELVKGGDLPPEVLANVDKFLDAIRRQKNWTLDFSLSPVSDSNINQASGGKEECIATVFGLLCRPLQEKASGYGLSASATGNSFWRFHQDWGLRATLGVSGVQYEESAYNDSSLYAALGPRYLWESGEASVQGAFRKRWIGDQNENRKRGLRPDGWFTGKDYSSERGLRFDARQTYKRLLLDASASHSVAEYDNAYVNSILHGASWSFQLQPRYILTDRAFVQAGFAFLREDAKVRAWANDNRRYALGGYYVFPYGFALFLEGSFMRTVYKSPQWYVTEDYKIDEAVRRDVTRQFTASLSSSVLEQYGLTPILQYVYTIRTSNIWTREYERHRVNVLVNYRF